MKFSPVFTVSDAERAAPLPVRSARHFGCAVDAQGKHRVVELRDGARNPVIVGPAYDKPRDAIRAAAARSRELGK